MPDKDTALCRTCSGRRNVVVLADEPVRTEEGFFGPTWSETRYRILACAGCGTRFFQTISINADDLIEHKDNDGEKSFGMMPKETFQYWPPFSHRKRPEWVDYDWTKKESLKSLLDETYTALDNDLGVLAAIGMRTVFDSASEELGINPTATFANKLDQILKMGKIGADERTHLEALVTAGSAAAHRGWKPTSYQLTSMLHILEGFLFRNFIMPEGAKSLERVPAKLPRST